MTAEYRYSSVEGSLTVENKLEIEEGNNNNGKSASEVDVRMTADKVIVSNNSGNRTFLYIATCVGRYQRLL